MNVRRCRHGDASNRIETKCIWQRRPLTLASIVTSFVWCEDTKSQCDEIVFFRFVSCWWRIQMMRHEFDVHENMRRTICWFSVFFFFRKIKIKTKRIVDNVKLMTTSLSVFKFAFHESQETNWFQSGGRSFRLFPTEQKWFAIATECARARARMRIRSFCASLTNPFKTVANKTKKKCVHAIEQSIGQQNNVHVDDFRDRGQKRTSCNGIAASERRLKLKPKQNEWNNKRNKKMRRRHQRLVAFEASELNMFRQWQLQKANKNLFYSLSVSLYLLLRWLHYALC